MARSGRAAGGRARPVVVQQSFPDPRPTTNPYIVMLAESIRATPGVELRTFSWRRALLGRYDVFHAHWPEILVAGRTPVRALLRQLLSVALLVRLGLTRTPIVRTLHNLERPSGIGRREGAFLAWFERRTALLILLNSSTPVPDRKLSEVILHGHYRDWFARFEQPEAVPGRFSYFGLIRPYKGVDALVSAFRGLTGDVSLRVAGRPSGDAVAAHLVELAGDDPRVEFTFAYVSDAELAQVACGGELVVLPYREMHNSGGTLAALSMSRPVLVPANEVNRRLRAEVGADWVHQYDGPLTADDLSRTLRTVQGRPAGVAPDLSRRDWDLAGSQHLAAYRRAIALRR